MTPTHTNKGGARYRYYVSQVARQTKPQPAGLVSRVAAAEIEAFVIAALRNHLKPNGAGEQLPDTDLELLERHLERVTLTPNHLELRLRKSFEPARADDPAHENALATRIADGTTITVPWAIPVPGAAKGIIHVPAHNTPMKPSRRESLLMAIAQARSWVDELVAGCVGSFAALARREGKAERHIRLLLPLAFLSPRIVSALLDGTAPADLTITALARALPWSWAEQERRLGLPWDEPAHPPHRHSASLLNGERMR
jgi:site-specific DNA recombinase